MLPIEEDIIEYDFAVEEELPVPPPSLPVRAPPPPSLPVRAPPPPPPINDVDALIAVLDELP